MEEVLRQFPPDKSGTSLAIYAVNRPVWPSEREEAAARHIPAHIWLFGQRIGDEVKLQGFLLVGSPKGFMVRRLTLAGELELTPISVAVSP